ncbi:MAG: hypothetical protein NC041_01100 [Bacteroides sp.]|nr:hypothetical protein [Prevotella sp.]MCM1408072.1 hypothetical protein [Treponema brennaborense]MCM1469048.1 hypothetical protein [Bacteroides sp.]
MGKQELIDRSPVRFFEKATNGGLKAGEIGVLASKKGLGKTSVLVQIGLDMLLQDKKVVHVSFNQQTLRVMTWYEDIFNEMAKKKAIINLGELKTELNKNRIVLNFNQDAVSSEQIVSTLRALASGGIRTDALIIDGVDFSKVSEAKINVLKEYAKEAQMVIWFSCNTESTLPDALAHADAVIHLEQKPDAIEMVVENIRGEALKNSNLKLDSKTLLIAEK